MFRYSFINERFNYLDYRVPDLGGNLVTRMGNINFKNNGISPNQITSTYDRFYLVCIF